MHFRILRMTATSGFLTALECTKFVIGRCSPDPLAGLRGTLLPRGRKGEQKEGKGEESMGGVLRGGVKEGKGTGDGPLTQIPGSAPGTDRCWWSVE